MPSRNKILQIVFGAGFNINETNNLLKHAGKSELYVKDKRDAVLMFAINRSFKLLETEELLEKQNCKSSLNDKP